MVTATTVKDDRPPLLKRALRLEAREGLPWLLIGWFVLVSLPLIWSAIALLVSGWAPQGDEAYVGIRAHDVFSSHPPLLGLRSTSANNNPDVHAHHPGPMSFYALAIPYALSGWSAWGLLLGSALIAITFVGISVHSAYRVAGWPGTVMVGLVALVLQRSFGEFLALPLNIWQGVLGLLAVLVLAWRLLMWQTECLPLFVVVGSFVAQVHIAFTPVVLILALVLAVVGLKRWYDERGTVWPLPGKDDPRTDEDGDEDGEPESAGWRRPGWWAAGLLILCWVPVLIDTFTYDPNNLSQLLRLSEAGPHPAVGMGVSIKHFLGQLVPLGNDSTSLIQGLLALALLGVCLWQAVRTWHVWRPWYPRKVRLGAAGSIGLAAVPVVLWTGSHIIGEFRMTYMDQVLPVALLVSGVACWALCREVFRERRRVPKKWHEPVQLGALAVGVVAALALTPTVPLAVEQANTYSINVDSAKPVVSKVMQMVDAAGAERPAVEVEPYGTASGGSIAPAISAALVSAGRDVYFDPTWPHAQDDDFRRRVQAPGNAIRVYLRERKPPQTWDARGIAQVPTGVISSHTFDIISGDGHRQIQVFITLPEAS